MLTHKQNQLRKRIIEISHLWHASHLGSCLTAVDALWAIHSIKKPNDPFILSNGHAGVALYTVLESIGILPTSVLNTLYVHPDYMPQYGIFASTGSLGQGLPIAIGMAIANRKRRVYCMISDGECSEGSIWESFRIIRDVQISNLTIVVNANGWGAYQKVNISVLSKQIQGFGFATIRLDGHNEIELKKAIKKIYTSPTILIAQTKNEQLPFLNGQDAHYYTMTDADYTLAHKFFS